PEPLEHQILLHIAFPLFASSPHSLFPEDSPPPSSSSLPLFSSFPFPLFLLSSLSLPFPLFSFSFLLFPLLFFSSFFYLSLTLLIFPISLQLFLSFPSFSLFFRL
ncbi:hypothetical protein, partial [Escherichia coli]|uniref:hypothetical protein n=1 Tax=Escherichia coli TaxID=562 RepID=UPI001BDB8948